MGIIKKYTENNCQIAIWDLKESLTELLKLGARFDSSNIKTEKRKNKTEKPFQSQRMTA